MSDKQKIIQTVHETNYDVISNIMDLFEIEIFDLDCTYSDGKFWKNLPEPINKTDIYPKNNSIIEANSENLPFSDQSMFSIMYDPPFIISGPTYKNAKKGSALTSKRFESYVSFDELKKNYYNTLTELYRICKKGGYVIVKCQDITYARKQYFSHVMLMNMAHSIGFYSRDLFILHTKNRINSFGSNWKIQEHARKHHTYFWVFQKKNYRVDYTIN